MGSRRDQEESRFDILVTIRKSGTRWNLGTEQSEVLGSELERKPETDTREFYEFYELKAACSSARWCSCGQGK